MYPGNPRVLQQGIPVINNTGVRLPAGPVATEGIDTQGRLKVQLASSSSLDGSVVFAELLIPKPLANGETGFGFTACQFTPDTNISTFAAGDFAWLKRDGSLHIGNQGDANNSDGDEIESMSQYIGMVQSPGTGAGNGIISGWLVQPAYLFANSQIPRPYSGRFSRSTSLSVTNNSATNVPLNFEHYSLSASGRVFRTGTGGDEHKVFFPYKGYWTISCRFNFTASATGLRRVRLMLYENPGTIELSHWEQSATTDEMHVSLTDQWFIADEDGSNYVYMEVLQTSGSTMNITPASNGMSIAVTRIGGDF